VVQLKVKSGLMSFLIRQPEGIKCAPDHAWRKTCTFFRITKRLTSPIGAVKHAAGIYPATDVDVTPATKRYF